MPSSALFPLVLLLAPPGPAQRALPLQAVPPPQVNVAPGAAPPPSSSPPPPAPEGSARPVTPIGATPDGPSNAPPPSLAPRTYGARPDDGAPAGPRVLHLDEALHTALVQQPTVLQARANTEAGEGRVDQARAPMLPQITGSLGYSRVHGTYRNGVGTGAGGAATPVNTTASSTVDYNLFTANATASQLIWDFGQTYERLRAAGRSVDALKASERVAQLSTMLNVRRTFFQARAQRALIHVAEQTLENQRKHLAQVEGFVGVGTRPEIDLAQARTDLANDRVQLITAQNNYEISKSQLNQAMGVRGDMHYDVADEGLATLDGEDEPNEQLIDRASKVRPELLMLAKQREAEQLTVKALKGAYGPTLSANASAGLTGLDLDALAPGISAGATLSWPLFQGGLTRGQVREAEANVSGLQAQVDGEVLQVRFEVDQAALTLRAAKASIEAARDALLNARAQLDLAEGRYAAGVGSIIELGDAQVALTNAGAQAVQADYNLSTARAELLAALGRP